MLNLIKRWLGIEDLLAENAELKARLSKIDTNYFRMGNHVAGMQNQIDAKLEEFQKLHEMDADENYRGQCTIILTGVFRGRGYVKFVDVEHDEFRHMVEMYRGRKPLFRNEDRIMYQGGSFSI